MKTPIRFGVLCCAVQALAAIAVAQNSPVDLKFDFGPGTPKSGYVRVDAGAKYSDGTAFGFEPGAETRFSVRVPEGNYTVTATFGDAHAATTTTLKAESGRLMIERATTAAGQVAERSFTTNTRTSHLAKLPLNATGREEVSLDQFDRSNALDWDDKLTVEVVSDHPSLRTLTIVSAPSAPTVFLAGDSTVTDRDGGGDVSWGQLLPRFLKPGVAVSNHAQSGETLKSFANALRLDKILSQMKKGDYLFIQFGHNDSKESWPQTYAEAATTYKAYLKVYIAEAKRRGATPVLVTPMDRGDRKTGAPQHGHGDYVPAMKEVASEEHVALIDLYTMSDTFYEHAGADAPKILADGTHSTAYGGYEFAKCVVMGIRTSGLDLAKYVVDDFKAFEPARPDTADSLKLEGLFRTSNPRENEAKKPGLGPT